MPRFFFHLRSNGRHAVDLEGSELPDLAAARADALAAAQQILGEALKVGASPGELMIEIIGEDGRFVDSVAVAIAVHVRFPFEIETLDAEAGGRPYHL